MGVYVFKNSQQGFSLIGILVAVAVMGILVLGLTTMISHLNHQTAQTAAKVSAISLSQDIRMALSNRDHCRATFDRFVVPSDLNADTTQVIANGLDISTIGRVTPGQPFSRYNLYVYNLYLSNFHDNGYGTYTADLMGQFQANIGQSPNSQMSSMNLQPIVLSKLLLEVNGSQQVTSCTLTSDTSSGFPPLCEGSRQPGSILSPGGLDILHSCNPDTAINPYSTSPSSLRHRANDRFATSLGPCYCHVIVAQGQACTSCARVPPPENSPNGSGEGTGH